MHSPSAVRWTLLTPIVAVTMAVALTQPGRAQTVRGQARAVDTTVYDLVGSTSVALADTGTLTDSTDARAASQSAGSVSSIFRGGTLHAATLGWPDQVSSEASAADIALSVGGNAISADFVMSRARAVQGAAATAAVDVDGLSVNGVAIPVTGEPNQTVAILGGQLVINERLQSATGTTVNALRVAVAGVADVVVASATADIR